MRRYTIAGLFAVEADALVAKELIIVYGQEDMKIASHGPAMKYIAK